MSPEPVIVQGGMGVGVSSPQLAAAVARRGQLGVVSGTAVAVTLARRLWRGDGDGSIRRALAAFPDAAVARRIIDRYWRPDPAAGSFPSVPQFTLVPPRSLVALTVAAAFVEVWLAKEGHAGRIGINLLEKLQLPTLPTLYGAMLAGVDDVLMGAGIPSRIPAVLDRLSEHLPVDLPVAVSGADRGTQRMTSFDPADIVPDARRELTRPRFSAIVSSVTLAKHLTSVHPGPDGFVVELPVAGGHNAPPRGRLTTDADGQPVYGPRDEVDLGEIAALGRPFWVAGGYADPERLHTAQAAGAAGVQVGTAFAFCRESGLDPTLRRRVLEAVTSGRVSIRTDALASPTGYPFKIATLMDTIGDDKTYGARSRHCDLGYLREPYVRPDGRIGFRCPAEPVEDYLAKGGAALDTVGRRCLCNGLIATIGLPQARASGYVEPPLVTAGDDLVDLGRFLTDGRTDYTAADVIDHVLGNDSRPRSTAQSHETGEEPPWGASASAISPNGRT